MHDIFLEYDSTWKVCRRQRVCVSREQWSCHESRMCAALSKIHRFIRIEREKKYKKRHSCRVLFIHRALLFYATIALVESISAFFVYLFISAKVLCNRLGVCVTCMSHTYGRRYHRKTVRSIDHDAHNAHVLNAPLVNLPDTLSARTRTYRHIKWMKWGESCMCNLFCVLVVIRMLSACGQWESFFFFFITISRPLLISFIWSSAT